MELFNFRKKKEESTSCGEGVESRSNCACGDRCYTGDVQNTRFIVLGACCKKSADTFANVKQAVAELGYSDDVLNVADAVQIATYGVMQTPALVIDGKVVSYGKLIKVEEAKKLIKKTVDGLE